jgi:hypothetical protein
MVSRDGARRRSRSLAQRAIEELSLERAPGAPSLGAGVILREAAASATRDVLENERRRRGGDRFVAQYPPVPQSLRAHERRVRP